MEEIIAQSVKQRFSVDIEVQLSRPDAQFGDYASNVALQLARQVEKNPREIAEEIASDLRETGVFSEVSVAGPGFLNFRLSSRAINDALDISYQPKEGQSVVIETNNPNPFKDLHIGHAYNCIFADTVANLLEYGGAQTNRVSYHGDVGLHVGKSMWAILRHVDGDASKLDVISAAERATFLSKCYVEGSKAYAEDESAKQEIEALAKQSFVLDDALYKNVYEACKAWSFEYLDGVLLRLGNQPTIRRFLESETDPAGVSVVKENVGKVFDESEGAIIFKGEDYGLHTRVFVSSRGTGLYEARDLGLMKLKQQEFSPVKSYIVTGEEQRDYFNVVIKAAELSMPDMAGVTQNIPTGMVKLSTGKMSSRTGEVVNIEWLFDKLEQAAKSHSGTVDPDVILGALRWSLLKVRVGGDIVFDIEESVSIEGNSGPYLQYAHARAASILAKREAVKRPLGDEQLDENERILALKLGEYSNVLNTAIAELLPHQICTYLYELAQTFNRFYEKSRVLDDPREDVRLQLIDRYTKTLKDGLGILGIPAPDKM
ncbi:arginine--tRNA ligase [Candidatus Saccharibacteria bacterium]|nr:arginine--tRNA ligase [Candidatus Saccharibacteria bacterium]